MTGIAAVDPSLNQKSDWSTHFLLRSSLILSIAIAAIMTTAGILAIMATHSSLPPLLQSFSYLKSIGIVNSYVISFGGGSLFLMGVGAWIFHFNQTSLSKGSVQNK